jgi:sporulation protein YlmC with PRC-barrel domain
MMKYLSILACGMAALMVVSTSTLAQDTAPLRQRAPAQTDRAPDRSPAGQFDSATSGNAIRASKMMGMNIQNPQGKNVGSVNDFVLDPDSGKIRYVAVTYGGFLGIGSKMFAVPFEAFQIRQDPNNRAVSILVLDVSQQKLEGAEGFDDNNWPDFADTKFTTDLDKRYGVDRTQVPERGARGNVEGTATPRDRGSRDNN